MELSLLTVESGTSYSSERVFFSHFDLLLFDADKFKKDMWQLVGARQRAPLHLPSFRAAAKRRTRNPASKVAKYWIPGSLAALRPRNDGDSNLGHG